MGGQVLNTIVYYHKNCSDGFGAAYAAWKHFGTDATYEAIPNGKEVNADGYDQVFFLDIVPPNLEEVARDVASVVVIDHHKSAIEKWGWGRTPASALVKRNITFHFDMTHSAAVLAWQHFHDTPVPWLLSYVEDVDLWTRKMAKTDEVNASIRSYPFDFLVWDRFTTANDLAKIGEHVLRTERMYWGRSLDNVQWVDLSGHKVPVINTTVGGSEAANALLERHRVDVAGYYFDRGDGVRQWGLRSNGKVDVSELVSRYGGGGHARAAGFQTPITSPWIAPAWILPKVA